MSFKRLVTPCLGLRDFVRALVKIRGPGDAPKKPLSGGRTIMIVDPRAVPPLRGAN
jgi:hypothetical protein